MAVVSSSSLDYDRMKEVKEFDDSKLGVKGLTDSGITTIPKIFIHPPETLSTIKKSSLKSADEIPVIDLSNVTSPQHRPEIVQKIREAAKEWGFFQVLNHGVSVPVLEKILSSLKSFHEQPLEVRSKHYARSELNGFMYASNNDLYRSKVASWCDFIHAFMAPGPVNLERAPMPLRDDVVEWDQHAKTVGELVAELLSEGLGLEAGKLKEAGLLVARSIAGVYYPYCAQPDLTLGLSSHTDPGVLTVLLQNQVLGLQVKHGDEWVDVKPLFGGLIINIGDALQIMSNGEYRSVEHRVLANSLQQPKISIVEFFNFGKQLNESHCYGPFPELLSPETPPRYRNFTVKEFMENFFSKGLDSKSLVHKLML